MDGRRCRGEKKKEEEKRERKRLYTSCFYLKIFKRKRGPGAFSTMLLYVSIFSIFFPQQLFFFFPVFVCVYFGGSCCCFESNQENRLAFYISGVISSKKSMELNKVAHFKDVFFTFWNVSFRMLDISGFSIHLLGYHSSLATNGSLKYRDTNIYLHRCCRSW